MKVFIVGYPRTATSGIYKYICRMYGLYCFFEPFNPDVMLNLERHVHDRIGRPPMDYDMLSSNELEFIMENSKWFIDWVEHDYPSTQYLGDYGRVLDTLFSYGDVVVKDVYAWPLLPHLVEQYSDILFIVPVRQPYYVYRSLLGWYRNKHPLHRLYRAARQYARRFMKVFRQPSKITRAGSIVREIAVKTRRFRFRAYNPRNMLSIGVFYRALYGTNNYPRLPTILFGKYILTKMFLRTYNAYMRYVSSLMDKPNVRIVFFEDRLDLRLLDKLFTTEKVVVIG